MSREWQCRQQRQQEGRRGGRCGGGGGRKDRNEEGTISSMGRETHAFCLEMGFVSEAALTLQCQTAEFFRV